MLVRSFLIHTGASRMSCCQVSCCGRSSSSLRMMPRCEVAWHAAFKGDAAVSYLYDSCRAGGDVFGSHRDLCGQSEVVGRGIAGGQYLRLVATGYGGDDLRGLRVNYAEAASDGLEVYAECYAYEDVFPAQVGKYLPDILFIVAGEGGCEEKGSVLAGGRGCFSPKGLRDHPQDD